MPDPSIPSRRLIALGAPEANERDAIALLDQTLDPAWVIFHSRKPLRGSMDIDLLILTPHGAFAAELKYYRDPVTVSRGPTWQRRLADGTIDVLPNMLQGQAQKQAQKLKAEWKAVAGLSHVWIEPVVIFTHPEGRIAYAPADQALLAPVVFCLNNAKAKLEHLVDHNRNTRRPVAWEDVQKIAATFGQAAALPKDINWPAVQHSATVPRNDDRAERQRRRRTKQILSILTLIGALLVTVTIYHALG
jgi:hypothetical protein